MTEQKIADMMRRAELAIEGIQGSQPIKIALAPRGYDQARLAEDTALLTAAKAALATLDSKSAHQKDSTVTYQHAFKDTRADATDLTRTCRAVLTGNPEALRTLGLAGNAVPRNLNDFLRFADGLIAVLETGPQELRDSLAAFGVNAARCATLKTKLAALRAADSAAEAAKAARQQATADAQAALKALDAAVMRLRKLARLALKDQPQLLETLGIMA